MKQRQKKKPLADSVSTGSKRLREDGTCQSPPSIFILSHRGKPAPKVTTHWTKVEPTLELKRLFRLLLSPPQKGGQI